MDLGSYGRFEVDFSTPTLFKRCANCPPTPPPCPQCEADEICSLIAGGCDTCARTMCTKIGSDSTSSTSSGGGKSAAGPIAGGVIGGIVVVCLVTFLVWRFCIRNRRLAYSDSDWQDFKEVEEKGSDEYDTQRNGRASVHSVRSIASTVLTRASNVIPIAYIPGVTNRSVESTPDLIPPVPPIPAASPGGTPYTNLEEHYFMPSDLRQSTYSDYSVNRDSSYARSSMTPSVARGSVPSTAYRGSAIVNAIPAQTAIRGKANPVAVGSGGKNSPAGARTATPPAPIMERSRPTLRQATIETNTSSPIVARLGVPKAVEVKKAQSRDNLAVATPVDVPKIPSPAHSDKSQKSIPGRQSVVSSRHNADASTFDDASSSDEESPADRSLMGHEKLPQFAKKNSPARESFFGKPSSAPDLRESGAMYSQSSSPDIQSDHAGKDIRKKHKRSGSLNQIIQEAARRASKEPRHGGLGSVGNIEMASTWRDKEGPFSDAHAAGTP